MKTTGSVRRYTYDTAYTVTVTAVSPGSGSVSAVSPDPGYRRVAGHGGTTRQNRTTRVSCRSRTSCCAT
jgi:hypothetical protein